MNSTTQRFSRRCGERKPTSGNEPISGPYMSERRFNAALLAVALTAACYVVGCALADWTAYLK